MQNGLYRKAGVSPAYFVSLYGKAFSCEQVFGQIEILKSMGFSALQLEIFERSRLEDWQRGGLIRILELMDRYDLVCPAFVAHFLGEAFTNDVMLKDREFLSLLDEVLVMLEPMDKKIPLSVPFLPYLDKAPLAMQEILARERLLEMMTMVSKVGRDLIIEIVPGSLAQSYSHFMDSPFWTPLKDKIGFLLDTGHAHVSRENIPNLILKMDKDLRVLHLSDNDGLVNNSHAPGEGNLDWSAILASLDQIGFSGTLDLEIVDREEVLREKYLQGLNYLKSIMQFMDI